MNTFGDTTITLTDDTSAHLVDVRGKGLRAGVYITTWGSGDDALTRIDLTADEALKLAQALTLAATTSQRLNDVRDEADAKLAAKAQEAPVSATQRRIAADALEAARDNAGPTVAQAKATAAVTRTDVINAIESFCMIANHDPLKPQGYSFYPDTPGRKFTRIVMSARGARSVHCFIDNATGDVLKSAGWKTPAKGARGNIVTGLDDIEARYNWTGHYLYAR
jgi:hypothetical protein